MFGAIKES